MKPLYDTWILFNIIFDNKSLGKITWKCHLDGFYNVPDFVENKYLV